MIKRILSIIIAVVFSVCLLSVNCSAFRFNGDNRTITEAYSEWFQNIKEFLSGNIDFEAFKKNNEQFQADIVGLNLFPTSSDLVCGKIEDFQNYVNSVVDGTSNTVDDTVVDILGQVLEPFGIFDFREQFEQWYQDTYGKEYGKHENAFDHNFDTNGMNYYIYYHSSSGIYEYKMFLYYDGPALTVYDMKNGSYQYFLGSELGTITYRVYSRVERVDGWTDWECGDTYVSSTSAKFFVKGTADYTVTSTNLPLNYWGDILGGDPVIDWDKEFGGGGESGEPPGLTAPEFQDLIDKLAELITEMQPDNTTIENTINNIYNKIVNMNNQLHADLSKVIEYLKKILKEVSDFFASFFEKLGEFFQSVFLPEDGYIESALMDIQAAFDDCFSFAGSLKTIVDNAITAYKNGGKNPPEINVKIDGFGLNHKLDFSIFDDSSVELFRSVICAFCYVSFALSTFRRIPLYISGGGDR